MRRKKDRGTKIAKLRQTNSVRNYIMKFQTITANLDWDSGALEDKFQEGLKQNIRNTHLLSDGPREFGRIWKNSYKDRPRTMVSTRTTRLSDNEIFRQAKYGHERQRTQKAM